jgi:hypothetical protein
MGLKDSGIYLPSIHSSETKEMTISDSKRDLILDRHFELIKNLNLNSKHKTFDTTRSSGETGEHTRNTSTDISYSVEKQEMIGGKTYSLIF